MFLCVTALAPWRLPTPGGVVLGGESGNRFDLLSLGRHGNIHAFELIYKVLVKVGGEQPKMTHKPSDAHASLAEEDRMWRSAGRATGQWPPTVSLPGILTTTTMRRNSGTVR